MIKDVSLIKSSTQTVKHFADIFQETILNSENETLSSSPASVFSNIFSAVGDLNANSYLEQQAIKLEMHKNTAILLKSLLRYLTDEEIAGIFAYPAQSTFFIALPYNYLLKNAIYDPSLNNNIKKVRINKDSTIVVMNKISFILDHSINILILNSETDNPTFNISYDMSDKYSDAFSAIQNPYINNKIYDYAGTKYVGFTVIGRAYKRNTSIFQLNIDTNTDKLIEYKDQLMGFEVLYQSATTNTYTRLTGYPEGVNPINGYNYSLLSKNGINYIKITFSKNSKDFQVGSHSTLKIITYTTTGIESNISFPNLDEDIENNIQLILKQDSTNAFEQAIATVTPAITTKETESFGGRNQLSFEEIREYVINKSSINKTITPSDLDRKMKEFGCTYEKIRHDALILLYRINTILKDENNYISSGLGIFRFNLNDIPIRNEIKARIIKPNHIFKLNEEDEVFYYQPNPCELVDYLADYRLNKAFQVSFPFFIKMYFGDVVEAKVFNMATEKNYFTGINYYDEYALDTVAIDKVLVYRNPTFELPTEKDISEGYEGFWNINFTANVGKNIYEILQKEYQNKTQSPTVKFRIIINSGEQKYYTDGEIVQFNQLNNNNNLRVRSTLVTNNNINNNDWLCINNNSLIPVPIPLIWEDFYYIKPQIDVKIAVLFKSEDMFDSRNEQNDLYIKESELQEKYYIPIIYDVGTITLSEDLSKYFNLNLDVKLNDASYQKYEKDVYQTYNETIYEKDEDGQIVYENVEITNDLGQINTIRMPKILHAKGETVYGEDNKPIILHRNGEIIRNENGNPIQTDKVSYHCLVKYVPWYDRIFNNPSKYFDILKSYLDHISIMDTLVQELIDKVELAFGLKKTSGKSNLYQIYNSRTESFEQLDNIAISLYFGVGFSSIMSQEDKEFNVQNMIEKTKEYIYNFKSNIFSISELFNYLKSAVPSIEFLEFYNLNNYPSNVCQSIHKIVDVDSADNETLCVKMDIDDENSDFNEGDIKFIPAIQIKIL